MVMKTKLLITGLALVAATVMVNAQQGNGKGCGKCKGKSSGTAYVDKNNDGVCDNFEKKQAGTTTKKGNGSGNCDGTGKVKSKGNGQGKGKNFVDANKDGVCDNKESNTKK
jgi:hypothetical protein